MVTKTSIISLILIVLVHHLYIFLKTNLTMPKIKDLVDKPVLRYEEIYNTIKQKPSSTNMKNELKQYLQTLSKKKVVSVGGTGDNPLKNNVLPWQAY